MLLKKKKRKRKHTNHTHTNVYRTKIFVEFSFNSCFHVRKCNQMTQTKRNEMTYTPSWNMESNFDSILQEIKKNIF